MKKNILILIISIFTMLIFSCNDDSDLGYDIIPDSERLNVEIVDTLSISTYTLSMDTIPTGNPSQLIAGELDDPIFGNTLAGFVTQFTLAEYPIIDTSVVADSIVLILPYSTDTTKYYGSLSSSQEITVFKVSSDLLYDTAYSAYHNPDEIHSGEILGSRIFRAFPADSFLRVTLNPAYADSFLYADESVYYSEDNFKAFFKGIYVKSEKVDGSGTLVKYEVNQDMIINIYYHLSTNPEEVKSFMISANSPYCIKFNMFTHDYTNVPLNTIIDDTLSIQDSVSYIQGAGGLRTKIYIPYINKLNDLGPINIYRAELVIKTAPDYLSLESTYPAITKLMLTRIDSENEYYPLFEYSGELSYMGEYYNNGEYRFDIANYIREIMNEDIQNKGLYLFPVTGSENFNRSVITSGRNSNRMKLIITYTKL